MVIIEFTENENPGRYWWGVQSRRAKLEDVLAMLEHRGIEVDEVKLSRGVATIAARMRETVQA